MKFNVLRAVAATLSMGVCTVASAQYGPNPYGGQPYNGYTNTAQPNVGPTSQLGVPQTQSVQTFGGGNYQQPANNYQAPAKWNNFGVPNNGPQLFQPASTGGYDSQLPPPESIPTPAPSYGESLAAPTQQHVAPAQPAPSYAAPSATVHQHSGTHQHSTVHQHSAPIEHHAAPVEYGSASGDCQSCAQPSPYMQAASQPWEGSSYAAQSCGMPAAAPVRAPLFPWFGSFDLLFFNMDTNGKDRNIVSRYDTADPTRPYLPLMGIGSIEPDSALGYSLSFGRYLGCGQYGLGVTYFNWDPDSEMYNSPVYTAEDSIANGGGGGALRASGMPQYHGAQMPYNYDNGGGTYNALNGGAAYSIYDIIDGRAGQSALDGGDTNAAPGGAGTNSYAEATQFRARRDVDIQGLEVNLFSFGLMGAQRASAASCGTGHGFGHKMKSFMGFGGYGGVGGYGGAQYGGYGSCNTGACPPAACQPCGPRFGYGGAAGPLVRPCNGKVQVVTSHGLRWFQFKDSVDYAFDVDGRAGYTMNDIYDTTSTENDLFGYQFGSQLIYCLGSRVNFNVGGKFGLYGNQAEFRHRLGTQDTAAELAAMPGLAIDYETTDTVLSTLGEFDLGLGVRVSNCWTIRGGYRVLGATGLAIADNYSRDYSSSASASALHADSSLILHGAYLGANFNW
ncbi:hypothetical protein LOC71_22620 [Rhodopirellula sp. JC740]|uniref:Uncharacterized protein n=1 Tax=Rhodopirellula halodulae TaxID=2894198 RepID=A0ABS8NQ41_9BACT|nr:hypothetical protein [Rhodopirellula sp. JC740]MCC9645082.1 hypothetical protein [Rhodopirellula sp. JC740]